MTMAGVILVGSATTRPGAKASLMSAFRGSSERMKERELIVQINNNLLALSQMRRRSVEQGRLIKRLTENFRKLEVKLKRDQPRANGGANLEE